MATVGIACASLRDLICLNDAGAGRAETEIPERDKS
jgi:hypothetical protein